MLTVSPSPFTVQLPDDFDSSYASVELARAHDAVNDDLRCCFDAAEKLVATAAGGEPFALVVTQSKTLTYSHGQRSFATAYNAALLIGNESTEPMLGSGDSIESAVVAALAERCAAAVA